MEETCFVLCDSLASLRATRWATPSATAEQRLQRAGGEDWRQILPRRRRQVSTPAAKACFLREYEAARRRILSWTLWLLAHTEIHDQSATRRKETSELMLTA